MEGCGRVMVITARGYQRAGEGATGQNPGQSWMAGRKPVASFVFGLPEKKGSGVRRSHTS